MTEPTSVNTWPELSFKDAKATYETVHMWTQIVGKIKMIKSPWINHSWHVTLLVTPCGLTTGDIPEKDDHFQIDFDFINHSLKIVTQKGERKEFSLKGLSVNGFYKNIVKTLSELGIDVSINKTPNEIVDGIPFDKDDTHATYNEKQIQDLHKALLKSNEVFTKFRAEFTGKCSPIHFFWGSFDLAVSRFSGRKAPKHPGGVPSLPNWVAEEAYSDEVCSCGFWPGNEMVPYAAFYCYIYPEPAKFNEAIVEPKEAFYHKDLREFILPYDAVQKANNPEETLMDFLHSTYKAAARLAEWDSHYKLA